MQDKLICVKIVAFYSILIINCFQTLQAASAVHGVGYQKDLERQGNVKRENVDDVNKTQKLVEIENTDVLGAVIVLEK